MKTAKSTWVHGGSLIVSEKDLVFEKVELLVQLGHFRAAITTTAFTTAISHPSAISTMSPSDSSPPRHHLSSPPRILLPVMLKKGVGAWSIRTSSFINDAWLVLLLAMEDVGGYADGARKIFFWKRLSFWDMYSFDNSDRAMVKESEGPGESHK
ncbi:Uncharacterized protein Rs2_10015 [Raphanus sativus]|nr:Uncharacterized protein Rs2_10015 [Raphanus sativus]